VLLEHVTLFVQAIMLAVLFGGATCGQATRLVVFSGMVQKHEERQDRLD
jgi:hypothetical protein